jgi:hypothetical protein
LSPITNTRKCTTDGSTNASDSRSGNNTNGTAERDTANDRSCQWIFGALIADRSFHITIARLYILLGLFDMFLDAVDGFMLIL